MHDNGHERSRVTDALHTRVDTTKAHPTVTPLFQTSAFQSGSEFFYSRSNNPNTQELEEALCALAGARHAIATSTGMAAVSLVAGLLRPGDLVVVNRLTYGCTFRFLQRLETARDIRVLPLDLATDDGVAEIPDHARMVFFETPTNPFLETISIGKVAEKVAVKAGGDGTETLVVVDNTWATPLHQLPLDHGAAISLHSATKYFSGHSDVMGGIVLTNDDNLAQALREERFYSGSTLSAHDSWLLRRSLQTLAVRMEHHVRSTRTLADFLRARPEVLTVFEPDVDGDQLLAYGGIIFIELDPKLSGGYQALASTLELFTTGTGMAAVTAMIAQPCTGSHASLTHEELEWMGIGPELVRLCFGLENPSDLCADLARGLDALR